MSGEIIARAIPRSKNGKIGDVAATYVTQSSCPSTCPLMGAGCYAEGGRAGITTRRLNDAAEDASALDCAIAEAAEIDRLPDNGRDLRLHVVGDCRTNAAAKRVSAAAERYMGRSPGAAVWTYTHAWRNVNRASWGRVSVLASVENRADAALAAARGYAVAMVVAEHETDRAEVVDGARSVPCVEQTRGRTCVECRLCFDDAGLRDRATPAIITFAVHGASSKRAAAAVNAA